MTPWPVVCPLNSRLGVKGKAVEFTQHARSRMAERAGLEINPDRLTAMWHRMSLPDLADGDHSVHVDGHDIILVVRNGRVLTVLSGDMTTVKRAK